MMVFTSSEAKDVTVYNVCGKYSKATVARKDAETLHVICPNKKVGLVIKNVCKGQKVKIEPSGLTIKISCQ